MNVLSLFDGISCGQQALKELGIQVDNYFACEIDKNAIAIAQKNHPKTIQLGSVTDLDTSSLPKIDLILAGSPCQGFSAAGKQQGFDDPRSNLFFEFIRILNEVKPTYFLLENVKMKREWLDKIDFYTGVKGVEINSYLFSAQSRSRYYWTNLTIPKLPPACNTVIDDIRDKSDLTNIPDDERYKFVPVTKHSSKVVIIGLGGYLKNTETPRSTLNYIITLSKFRSHQRTVSSKGKYPCMTSRNGAIVQFDDFARRPNPIELERLQTLPDNYTAGFSKTARKKTLGNAWNVATIKFILERCD